MGISASANLHEPDMMDIQKETGFSDADMKRLYHRFKALNKSGSGQLSKEDFMNISDFAINPLASRLLCLFFRSEEEEPKELEKIDFRKFMLTLARFRTVKPQGGNIMNSRREKLKYAFKIYDIDNDGRISQTELVDLIRMMVGTNISEEQLASIADRMVLEADGDQDGFITFEEFVKVLESVDIEQKMSIRYM